MPAQPNPKHQTKSLSKCRVLIADNDRLNLRMLRDIFQSEGYALEESSSGEVTPEVYPAFQPDLILLDVMLPEINGFETSRRLIAQDGGDGAPHHLHHCEKRIK